MEPARGTAGPDVRLTVSARWSDVPIGAEKATLTVTGPQGATATVTVPLLNPAAPRPETLDGFLEANGSVSIEAEHTSRRVAPSGREWKVLPDHGRTLSGLTPWPVTSTIAAVDPSRPDAMRLEYRVHLFHAGGVSVQAFLSPTQKFQPGPGFRYAISFDDEPPQVVNVHADASPAAWERAVADGVTVLSSQHALGAPGAHVLKYWALDPGLVLQKLVIDTGGLKPSYLGPPESAFRLSAPGPPPARPR